ncbi:MAG TPA: hydrogenase maturation protease [Actinomycetota bacterium]|jgi:hydrogenase maturation protease|nr:hydrogenase maturation protease [Actinomycetota bacterium]HXL41509.1 hydrogenase maturation protease [Actinomycetota bacterium]
MQILVAGVGNLLRGDDGFGVEVAKALLDRSLPPEVRVVETGIGGIHLVQEMLAPTDALLVIDAVDLGRPPGTVLVVQPEVIDVHTLTPMERFDALADMHYAKPERAFMLAKALGVLPGRFLMVGCQPVDADSLGEGLTPQVAMAVPVAVAEVEHIVTQWLAEQEMVG